MWSALQAGDKNALLLIYQHFYIDFMNFGLRLTGDRGLTSDCITQSLLHLWDKRASLPPVTNLRPYLLTCLRHQIYATLRSDSRRVAHALAAHRFDATIEQSYEERLIETQTSNARRIMLEEALSKLTARERQLLCLKFFEDLEYDEIADRCGITKRTAYNLIHRALTSLRVQFTATPAETSPSLPQLF
jgi:RNA polymerase sigma factor (sigma-70 family)